MRCSLESFNVRSGAPKVQSLVIHLDLATENLLSFPFILLAYVALKPFKRLAGVSIVEQRRELIFFARLSYDLESIIYDVSIEDLIDADVTVTKAEV